jgi:hypothetical protein
MNIKKQRGKTHTHARTLHTHGTHAHTRARMRENRTAQNDF